MSRPKSAYLPPNTLRFAGERLFGPTWHRGMATAIGKTIRAVRYMEDGTIGITKEVAEKILHLMEERQADWPPALLELRYALLKQEKRKEKSARWLQYKALKNEDRTKRRAAARAEAKKQEYLEFDQAERRRHDAQAVVDMAEFMQRHRLPQPKADEEKPKPTPTVPPWER